MERSGIVYYKSKSCIQALEKSYICTKICNNSIFGRKFFSYTTHINICTKFWSNSIFGRKLFSYTTQVKVCTKFWSNSIFGRKWFFFHNTQVNICTKFWSNSIFGRKFFFLHCTCKHFHKILKQLHFYWNAFNWMKPATH